MKILAVIDDGLPPCAGARAQQHQWTNLAAVWKLIGSRIEFGQSDFAFDQNGIIAHMRIEQSSPIAKSENDEAA